MLKYSISYLTPHNIFLSFYLRRKITLTSTNLMIETPNTVCCFYPVGVNHVSIPLKQISSIEVDWSINVIVFVFAILLIILAFLSSLLDLLFGIVVLLFFIPLVLMLILVYGLSCRLSISSTGQPIYAIPILWTDKDSIQRFAAKAKAIIKAEEEKQTSSTN